MSDPISGSVTFPKWACKYIGLNPDKNHYSDTYEYDDGTIQVFDHSARNGEIDLREKLDDLHIGYDAHHESYCEIQEEDYQVRFNPDGTEEERYFYNDTGTLDAKPLLELLDAGKLDDLRQMLVAGVECAERHPVKVSDLKEEDWLRDFGHFYAASVPQPTA